MEAKSLGWTDLDSKDAAERFKRNYKWSLTKRLFLEMSFGFGEDPWTKAAMNFKSLLELEMKFIKVLKMY